jgi:hypothetical protein
VYRAVALVLLNTLVVFAVVNGVLFVVLRAGSPGDDAPGPVGPGSPRYEAGVRTAVAAGAFAAQERFYPHLGPADVAGLMLETWLLRPYVYEPFTEFAEGPYRGRFVNVDANGFRLGRGRAPWPPDREHLNVFVFGGSTTFGYGLPDDQTVPAHLEDWLGRARGGRAVRVYNFGRGYYFSSQEGVLFERLLAAGAVPDVAVFVDGLNEFYNTSGEPQFSARLRAFMRDPAPPAPNALRTLATELPIVRAAARLREWASATRHEGPVRPPIPAEETRATPLPADATAVAERLIDRFLENKRIIEAVAGAYGVRPLFVWQPVPTYAYDLRYHPFANRALGAHQLSRVGYPRMAARLAAGTLGPDLVWCAGLQEGRREALYLDSVHYTPQMARRVARCIARGMMRPRDQGGGIVSRGASPSSRCSSSARFWARRRFWCIKVETTTVRYRISARHSRMPKTKSSAGSYAMPSQCATTFHGRSQKLITSGVIVTTSHGSQSSSFSRRRRISSRTASVSASEPSGTTTWNRRNPIA